MGCALLQIRQVAVVEGWAALRAGEGGIGFDPKSFFCTALEKDRRQMRRAKLNKPNRLKTLVINRIAHEAEKRTQACYDPRYQSLTAILAPILRKFVWIALPYCGFGAAAPPWSRWPNVKKPWANHTSYSGRPRIFASVPPRISF